MNQFNIHERIFNYVIAVIKLINTLPKTSTNIILINQCIRSVTSMGTNDQEADGALTTNDFIHSYTIVRKEGKETVFWLRVLGELNITKKDATETLVNEGKEIVAIVSTIILRTSKSKKGLKMK